MLYLHREPLYECSGTEENYFIDFKLKSKWKLILDIILLLPLVFVCINDFECLESFASLEDVLWSQLIESLFN